MADIDCFLRLSRFLFSFSIKPFRQFEPSSAKNNRQSSLCLEIYIRGLKKKNIKRTSRNETLFLLSWKQSPNCQRKEATTDLSSALLFQAGFYILDKQVVHLSLPYPPKLSLDQGWVTLLALKGNMKGKLGIPGQYISM